MQLDPMTLDEIRLAHPGCYVQEFDAGLVDGPGAESVLALDVIVWLSEAASENDDGARALARYLIRA